MDMEAPLWSIVVKTPCVSFFLDPSNSLEEFCAVTSSCRTLLPGSQCWGWSRSFSSSGVVKPLNEVVPAKAVW